MYFINNLLRVLRLTQIFFSAEPRGNGYEFSISVTRSISVEAGLCVRVPCKFTYPQNTVTEPYRRIWFKGDPLNPLFETHTIYHAEGLKNSERDCSFLLTDAREGKTDGDYRFKLEWGDKRHVFSETVHVTVTGE